MTPAAQQRLDEYLLRLRTEVRGASAEAAGELEQNVREHIEIALAEAQTPVGEIEMIGILDRLGAPEQWLGEDEPRAVRRDAGAFAAAPSSSRLPYLSFGLATVSIVTFPMFGFILLLPAMFVSRSWIDQMRERGEPLGSRRWIVYPAIALAVAFAALLLFVLPPLFALKFTRDAEVMRAFDVPASAAGQLRFLAGLRALVFGLWWIVAGGVCAAGVRPIRFAFAPLLDRIRRTHFAIVAAIGAVIAVVGGVLVYFRH